MKLCSRTQESLTNLLWDGSHAGSLEGFHLDQRGGVQQHYQLLGINKVCIAGRTKFPQEGGKKDSLNQEKVLNMEALGFVLDMNA